MRSLAARAHRLRLPCASECVTPILDGTQEGTSESSVWLWWSSVASSCGSQRARMMFLYHVGVCGTAGGAWISVIQNSIFAVHLR